MNVEEFIQKCLSYNPETGDLIWSNPKNPRIVPGSSAGSPNQKGYLQVHIQGRMIAAHHIVWWLNTGEWPEGQLDHKDRNVSNNRFENLRPATTKDNSGNTKPRMGRRFKGVFAANSRSNPWQAVIAGRYLGVFPTQEAAAEAYDQAALQHFGEFAHLNFPKEDNHAAS